MTFDVVIVGAGLAGSVIAERCANELGLSVLLVERRNHIGGNCADECRSNGLRVAKYGPHYFRTNSDRILAYLGGFTDWRATDYKVLSFARGRFYSFPINLRTFEQFIGKKSTSAEMTSYFDKQREDIKRPSNAAEQIISQVGEEFFEMFYEGYSEKQWGVSPWELDAAVVKRIPIRYNYDDRYFDDKHQVMPAAGYQPMFEKMLRHPKIKILLQADWREVMKSVTRRHLVWTGPIDEYFDHSEGHLEYRSLRFAVEDLELASTQPALQVNYPGADEAWTRKVDYGWLNPHRGPVTTVVTEYPEEYFPGNNEPFYPLPTAEMKERAEQYTKMADDALGVSFVGRLATYRYLNMDQVVGQALTEFDKIKVIASKWKR